MTTMALLLIAAATALQATSPEPEMTTGGWIFLGLGWLFVGGLAVWCFRRVLGGEPPKG